MDEEISRETYELEEGSTKVELEWEGEGEDGEYQPDDPDDVPLMRFAVYAKDAAGEWQFVDDSSYCCQIDARAPDEVKQAALKQIMQEVKGETQIKRICERLSWMSAESLGFSAPAPKI